METSQQVNKHKISYRATLSQRLWGVLILVGVIVFFGVFRLASADKIDIGRWINPCGFKQRWGLPCPSCGMSSSILAFVRGRIFEAFYIQPAAGLLCCLLIVAGFLAFLTVFFGIYYEALRRFLTEVKIRYVILAVAIIILASWSVTLARGLSSFEF